VLLGIGVAAMAQVGNDEPSDVELAASTGDSFHSQPATTSASEPFEYRVGLLSGVSTSNFWEYVGEQPTAWNAYVLGPTKPALFGIDPADNTLVPDLAAGDATGLTWDENGWRARIELRGDLSWSDGQPVTAADVVYTFDTVRRLGLSGGWADAYPLEVQAIVAESDTELRIEFTERPGLRVWPYAIGLAPILPGHVWGPSTEPIDSAADLYALDGVDDVSGGPLQIVSLSDRQIQSVANPGYPGSAVDSVTYVVHPDEASAVSDLAKGALDVVLTPNGLSEESVTQLESADGVTIEKSPANSVRYLGFNLDREPMSEPAFRQAVALLLDLRAASVSLVPDASAAYTLITPANKSWFDEPSASAVARLYSGDLPDRLARALSALQAAGYAWATPPSVVDGDLSPGIGLSVNGTQPAPVTILAPGDEYDPARSDYTLRIETALEMLGFDVRPVVTDFDTVVDLAFTQDDAGVRQYDMYVLGWTLGNPALPDFYRLFFSSDGEFNSTGYANPGFERLLARYEQAPDVETAKLTLWEIEKALATDLPYLALYHPLIVEAYRSDRFEFGVDAASLGGIQSRLGGIGDLVPTQ